MGLGGTPAPNCKSVVSNSEQQIATIHFGNCVSSSDSQAFRFQNIVCSVVSVQFDEFTVNLPTYNSVLVYHPNESLDENEQVRFVLIMTNNMLPRCPVDPDGTQMFLLLCFFTTFSDIFYLVDIFVVTFWKMSNEYKR